MANLFKIEFVQGKTDASDYNQVKHSIIDSDSNRAILSLSVSADKLQSVSNYMREPKRLVFDCFPTSWIENNILSGSNEHERYISHYEVRVYRDNVLFFTGIIDTSLLSMDVSSGILKLTCFDKIKLLSVFSDIEHYWSLIAGYSPTWIMSYILNDIQQTIPINVPRGNNFRVPEYEVAPANSLILAHIHYKDMAELPAAPGWTFSWVQESWAAPKHGYYVISAANTVYWVFAHLVIYRADNGTGGYAYRAIFRGRIYRFYQNICPVVYHYDEMTDWQYSDPSLFLPDIDRFYEFFTENSIPIAMLSTLASTGTLNDVYYGSSQYAGNWVEAMVHGQIMPTLLHPGKGYEDLGSVQNTNNLKVLQAMLLLYNATIVGSVDGRIMLVNKGEYANDPIVIDTGDVVSMVKKRGNQEVPAIETLDILAGDTAQLQALIKPWLIGHYSGNWSFDLRIDNLDKYAIELQSKIQINSVDYGIIEVTRDYVNDEYKVIAWQL